MRIDARTPLALGGLLAAAACAEVPAQRLPSAVSAALLELAALCTGVGGTPRVENGVRRTELDGDGRPDFVLYAGWLVCENAWSIYGDRDKPVTAFLDDGRGGYAIAFTDSVYDVQLDTAAAAPRLLLTVSGTACGRPPADTFAQEAFCKRAVVWNAPAARLEYAPVATVEMIE